MTFKSKIILDKFVLAIWMIGLLLIPVFFRLKNWASVELKPELGFSVRGLWSKLELQMFPLYALGAVVLSLIITHIRKRKYLSQIDLEEGKLLLTGIRAYSDEFNITIELRNVDSIKPYHPPFGWFFGRVKVIYKVDDERNSVMLRIGNIEDYSKLVRLSSAPTPA